MYRYEYSQVVDLDMSISIWKAINDYEMIADGDRILVGLSGGKDSLSLLHALKQYQFYARSKVGDCNHCAA